MTYTLVIPFNATFTKKKQTYHFSFLFFFFLFFFPGQFERRYFNRGRQSCYGRETKQIRHEKWTKYPEGSKGQQFQFDTNYHVQSFLNYHWLVTNFICTLIILLIGAYSTIVGVTCNVETCTITTSLKRTIKSLFHFLTKVIRIDERGTWMLKDLIVWHELETNNLNKTLRQLGFL